MKRFLKANTCFRWRVPAQLDSTGVIRASCQKLRELQMEISLFNLSNSQLIYGIKLANIGAVILCGFLAIEFFATNYALGAMNYCITADGLIVYSLMYDRGFAVPRCIARLKACLRYLLKTQKNIPPRQGLYLDRYLQSIQSMAIRVGSFHTLQRCSTPTHVDFAVKNVARLLVACRRN